MRLTTRRLLFVPPEVSSLSTSSFSKPMSTPFLGCVPALNNRAVPTETASYRFMGVLRRPPLIIPSGSSPARNWNVWSKRANVCGAGGYVICVVHILIEKFEDAMPELLVSFKECEESKD